MAFQHPSLHIQMMIHANFLSTYLIPHFTYHFPKKKTHQKTNTFHNLHISPIFVGLFWNDANINILDILYTYWFDRMGSSVCVFVCVEWIKQQTRNRFSKSCTRLIIFYLHINTFIYIYICTKKRLPARNANK